MGVITSLGAGKADNWAKLTAGESGIRRITRFPPTASRPRIAGTVDFVPVEPFCSTELGERMADDGRRGGDRRGRHRHARATFPGPLFLAVAPVEIEWPQRDELAAASGANDAVGYDDLLRASASGRFRAIHERCLFGSVAEHLADRFGTKGSPISLSTACASGATAIQLGVEAIRRGETDAALCIGTDGSVNPESPDPLLAAVGAVDRRTIRRRRRQSRSPRTATASSWRKAPARWCSKATKPRRRAARKSSA